MKKEEIDNLKLLVSNQCNEIIALRKDVEEIKNEVAKIRIYVSNEEQRNRWEKALKENRGIM